MNIIPMLIFLTVLLSQCVYSLNILGIFPYEGKSHFFVFKPLLKELADRGHNVTVVSYFPQKDAPKNYHDIQLTSNFNVESSFPVQKSIMVSSIYAMLYLMNVGITNCENLVKHPRVQEMIDEKWKFDVILIEEFNNDCGFAIAHKIGAPVVAITSHVFTPWHYDRLGITYNGAYMPFHFFGGGTSPTLFQRVERTVFHHAYTTVYNLCRKFFQQRIAAKYLGDIPSLDDLSKNKKLTLLYHHFALTGTRLLPTNVIEVGGYHVAKSKPVTGALKKFMDEAEHGVIYISFGSVASMDTLSEDIISAIFNAVAELPQRFIFKYENDALAKKLSNVYFSKWLPQLDILGHPKLVAFHTHGGMLSTTEAITYGVPVVVTPILGDQPSNGACIQESGFGVTVSLWDMNKENIIAAYKKVIDPKFRANVKEISKRWHDRPAFAMNTSIYWIEYAGRNRDLNLTYPGATVPYYQALGLDVWAVLITILILVVFSLKAMFKMCRGKKAIAPVKASKPKRN